VPISDVTNVDALRPSIEISILDCVVLSFDFHCSPTHAQSSIECRRKRYKWCTPRASRYGATRRRRTEEGRNVVASSVLLRRHGNIDWLSVLVLRRSAAAANTDASELWELPTRPDL